MRIRHAVVPLTASLFACVLFSSAAADTLDGTLNRLDHAGSQFKAMEANFTYLKHTAIVNEDSNSTGKMKIKRIKHPAPTPDDILGILDFAAPDKKTVALNGKTVEIFLPNINTVQEVDLGKHKVLVEQFFLFGFGTSRSDLEAAYNVSYGGSETIKNEPATRLAMTSKNPDVAKQLTKFELWISDKTGEPVQQKFYEPSGDYNVFTYTEMKINPNLPEAALTLKLPKNVKKETLNK
jgi:outer membrane lipoprotein-sorting protein